MRIHLIDVTDPAPSSLPSPRLVRRDGFVTGLERAGHDVVLSEVTRAQLAADPQAVTAALDVGPVDVIHASSVAAVAVAPRGAPLVVSPRVSVSRVGGQSVVHVEPGAPQALAASDGRVRTVVIPSVEAASGWSPAAARIPVVVVPTGVDSETFTPDGPSAPGKPGRVRVLVVGLPGAAHGFLDVVRVLRHLPAVDVVFTAGPGTDLAGSTDAREAYALACSMGLGDRVTFAAPYGPELASTVLRSADIVLIASASDVTHHVALEAMACAKPIVVTNMGAFVDIVVDEVTGLVVPHGNEGALRSALRSLVDDAFYRDALGLAARDRAVSRFDWARVTAELVRVYERSIAASQPIDRTGTDRADGERADVERADSVDLTY